MNLKRSIIRGSHTRVAAAIYMAVFLVLIAFAIKHTIPFERKERVAVNVNTDLSSKYFKGLNLEAKAVFVHDTVTGEILFAKNEHLPLPLASITKIMTAVCSLDNLQNDGFITIPPSVLGDDGDTDLVSGENFKVEDLVSYMLVKSSNDAAMALSSALGGSENMLACMNSKAENMKLFDTHFENETGLDIGNRPGAYGSAEDAGELLAKARSKYPDIFGSTRYGSYNATSGEGEHEAINTNKVGDQIVGMQASKTGLTDLAGGNLVFEMDAGLGHTIAISILGSSVDGRFNDALELSKAVINYLGETK